MQGKDLLGAVRRWPSIHRTHSSRRFRMSVSRFAPTRDAHLKLVIELFPDFKARRC